MAAQGKEGMTLQVKETMAHQFTVGSWTWLTWLMDMAHMAHLDKKGMILQGKKAMARQTKGSVAHPD